jgi:hypothetical protein
MRTPASDMMCLFQKLDEFDRRLWFDQILKPIWAMFFLAFELRRGIAELLALDRASWRVVLSGKRRARPAFREATTALPSRLCSSPA